MNDQPKVKIDGVEYELPESLTLGEARILERYCHGHVEGEGYGLAKIAGMIHVAVARVRPDASFEEISERIDQLDLDELPQEADARPPDARNSELVSSENGNSEPASDASPGNENPSDSGVPDSDTGSRSFRRTSVT